MRPSTSSLPEFTSFYPEGAVSLGSACVFGASGLLGTELIAHLERSGCAVTRFSHTKRANRPDDAYWDPAIAKIEVARLEGTDAVINLAGESLSEGRWNTARKRRLWQSRVDGTALVARTLASLAQPPKVLINASAIGFYGDRGEEAVHEDSPPGTGFLADLCQAWEAATAPAKNAGIRVVCLRFGVILSPKGGALAAMLKPFRLGLGGRLGSGEQRMPWIALPDAAGVTRYAMRHPTLSGPVNAVSPESITNAQLTETLLRTLDKRGGPPVPAWVLTTALGELARETLLASANVRPRRLEEAGYRFEYPRLDDALPALLGQTRS